MIYAHGILKRLEWIELEGFVFPDDLRSNDIILVANKFEVETTLRAFQELGWKWVGGQDLLHGLDRLVNVLGISVWDGKALGRINRSAPAEMIYTYRRFFNASDIIPNLKNDFSEDLPDDMVKDALHDDDLPQVDLSKFLE